MDKEAAYKVVNNSAPSAEKAAEYIKAAEHGDGEGYWDYFSTPSELDYDVRLYFNLGGDR